MMRKLTASVLATAVLAGGALTGAALAAPSGSHSSDRVASVDRHAAKHSEAAKDRARHESSSRDRTSHARELDSARGR
jgi:hypothetical protein